jgi:hypothetical protein
MSFQKIVASSATQLNEALSKVDSGTIVTIVDPDTDINLKDLSLILEMFLNDDKIGFVFTDILINSNDVSFINYLNSKEIYSVSFFLRKPQEEIIVQEGDIKAQVIQQMISRGYTFEHIAEPVFCKKE